MVLHFERQRLLDEVAAEKDRILPELRKLRLRRSALKNLADLAEALFAAFDIHLENRIARTVDRIGRYDPDLASHRLNELSEGIRAILFLFSSVVDRQTVVPRELYDLVSWFFGQCEQITEVPLYVISTAEFFETNELGQFVDSLLERPGNRHLFPELRKISKRPFFFIFVPTSACATRGAFDWPIIFHECVHVLEEESGIVGDMFRGLPRNWGELDELANHWSVAKDALWTQELTCDFVATLVAGPAFLWRMLRRFFSLSAISHYSSTHPNIHTRVAQLITLTESLGFRFHTEAARQALKTVLKDVRDPSLSRPDPPPRAFAQAVARYRSRVKGFEQRDFDSQLTKKYSTTAEALINEIKIKRAVLADPSSLFTLIAFRNNIEADPKLAALVADFLRLHFIEAKFRSLGLKG